jgi:purine-nucleoside phosphorylase
MLCGINKQGYLSIMGKTPMNLRLATAARYLAEKAPFSPEIALILGSGMTDFVDSELENRLFIPAPLPEMPAPTAPGHNGGYLFGIWHNKKVIVMRGRIHFYEGYDIDEVVMPIRLLALLGVKNLIMTNAVGAINQNFKVGDMMVIRDHISTFMPSPLRGENLENFGERFVDMTEAYDKNLRQKIKSAAVNAGFNQIHEGTYIQLPGPQFETPAEIRMCRALGADAVGMSTAVETIAARHAGINVAAISWISNLAAGISENKITLEEVMREADIAAPKIKKLLSELFKIL